MYLRESLAIFNSYTSFPTFTRVWMENGIHIIFKTGNVCTPLSHSAVKIWIQIKYSSMKSASQKYCTVPGFQEYSA